MFQNIQEQKQYKNLVNGNWISSSKHIDILSPVDQSLLGTLPAMNKEEVATVIDGAKAAQRTWATLPVNARATILHKAAVLLEEEVDYLSLLLQKEIGKDKKSAISEIKRTADFIKFTADEGKHLEGKTIGSDNFPGFSKNKLSFVTRVPVGVVLAISPFNYPINLSASKIAPALMAGNSVIFKPATQGGLSGLHLVKIFQEAGVPAGVLNSITGKSSEIGDYVVSHKDIDFINFTGSTEVGKHIADIAGMVPMMMELGGKDAAIVLKDADLEKAAENIASGAYSYSGQRCTAIKRVLVLEEVADAFIHKLLPHIQKLKVGNPEEDAEITPLINTKAADFVEELIQDALAKGATLLLGNKREGTLLYPTLFDHVTTEMRLAWEEPFGPVLPILRVKNIEEAIQITNQSQYGLQASIFTENIHDAFYIADKLEVGTVQINSKTERGPDHFPFSGTKASGMGTQGIRYSIEAMTRAKATVLNLALS